MSSSWSYSRATDALFFHCLQIFLHFQRLHFCHLFQNLQRQKKARPERLESLELCKLPFITFLLVMRSSDIAVVLSGFSLVAFNLLPTVWSFVVSKGRDLDDDPQQKASWALLPSRPLSLA